MKKDKWYPLLPPDPDYLMNGIGAGPLGTGPLGVSPLGSYTGVTEDPLEVPVQDADDL